jgi:transposase
MLPVALTLLHPMSRYSLDLRKKVVEAREQHGTSIRNLAQRFAMSPATVHKLLKQYQTTQNLQPAKPGPKKPGKLKLNREFILEMVAQHPDWTLQQYCDTLLEERQIYTSLSGMCEFLSQEKITLKKRPIGVRRLPASQVRNSV